MFNLFNRININEYLEDYRNIDNAKLIDVRDLDEYENGRIPGSINIPLAEIEKIKNIIDDKDTPLFVYCLSKNLAANTPCFSNGDTADFR